MEGQKDASQEFNILKPEVAKAKAEALLSQALERVRVAIETCLKEAPQPGCSRLAKPVVVAGKVYRVPEQPDQSALTEFYAVWKELLGVRKTSPYALLHREDADESMVRRFPEFFAALFAWGFLYPSHEWADLVRYEREKGTGEEAYQEDVLHVFTGFKSGTDTSAPPVVWHGSRFHFNGKFEGRVQRIVADLLEINVSEIGGIEDCAAVAKSLLAAYPKLHQLGDAETTLTAMVFALRQEPVAT